MIEVSRLRALHAVATYGSVVAAAQVLYCTPSAVSQHLSKLEREVGSTVVEKDGRGLRLTSAGRVLVEHAGKVLAAVEEAEAALAAHHGSVTGRVTIAAFPTACRGLLPSALQELAQHHPQLATAMLEGDNRTNLDLVQRGEVELAVVDDWPEAPVEFPSTVEHVDLGGDIADLVVPAGHRLAATAKPVRLADIVDERWVANVPGSICHDWFTRVLPSVRPDFLVAEFETQLTLVAAGLAVALIPRLARTYLPAGVAVLPVRPTPKRRVAVAWRVASAVRPAVGAAVRALESAWQRRTTAG